MPPAPLSDPDQIHVGMETGDVPGTFTINLARERTRWTWRAVRFVELQAFIAAAGGPIGWHPLTYHGAMHLPLLSPALPRLVLNRPADLVVGFDPYG